MPGDSFTITTYTTLSRPTSPTPLVSQHDYNHQCPAFLLRIYNTFSNPFDSFPYTYHSLDTSIILRTVSHISFHHILRDSFYQPYSN